MPVKQLPKRPTAAPKAPEQEQEQKLSMTLPVRKVTKLPSNFLPYPPGTEISFVPYTFGELLNFSQSSLSKVDSVELMLKGIYTSKIEKHQLAFFDFVYIALLRKISSFKEDELTIEFRCSECGAKNSLTGKLTELQMQELKVPALPIVVKNDEGVALHFMPVTVGGYLDLFQTQKLEDKLEAYASTVVNMPREQARKIISEATGDFLRAIVYLDDVLSFGFEPMLLNCKECKTPNTLNMEDPEIFISPFRGIDGLMGTRISFGF